MAESSEDAVVELHSGALRVRICRCGASVMSLKYPDSSGSPRDVVLGFDRPADYLAKNSPYFGCVVGRVANRIANARFSLDGRTFLLTANDGPNTLHGGPTGLGNRLWSIDEASLTATSVTFNVSSADGDGGFPGNVEFSVTYNTPTPHQLLICMKAKPLNLPTPVSMVHHMYWNLHGHHQGNVLDHKLKLHASAYTPVGPTLIPTGEILPTAGTPFHFASPAAIGSHIASVPGGYDHNLVVDQVDLSSSEAMQVEGIRLLPVAHVTCEESGISLHLHASAPGVQFYTGNFLDGSVQGKGGVYYQKHSGFCLETQAFPDAVNQPKFPSITVSPGETYKHVMQFTLSS